MQQINHSKKHFIRHPGLGTVVSVSCDDLLNRDIPSPFNMVYSLQTMLQHVSMSEKGSYDFASYINARAKIYNFTALVVIFGVSSSLCGLFSDDLNTTLFHVYDFNSSVSTTVSSKSKTVSQEVLSKTFNIYTSLSSKAP